MVRRTLLLGLKKKSKNEFEGWFLVAEIRERIRLQYSKNFSTDLLDICASQILGVYTYGIPTRANLMIWPAIRLVYSRNSHRTGLALLLVVCGGPPAPGRRSALTSTSPEAMLGVEVVEAVTIGKILRASMFQTWLPFDFCFLPSSLNREM